MSQRAKNNSTEKKELHPRNKHREGYDFRKLSQYCPELEAFIILTKYQQQSIDFSNPEAVKFLNKALLKQFYDLDYWDIPPGYLCPPVPGRADYLHYMADLLAARNAGKQPPGHLINVLDIGTGANLIYPILGVSEYGWNFTGGEIDPEALKSAGKIIEKNSRLKNLVKTRLQKSPANIFKNILQPGDRFDLTVCNPPFHASAEEANAGTERKWKNLGYQKKNRPKLNFGGQRTELWCEGGERAFVYKMITESALFPLQCFWFSTLVSKSSNLPSVYGALEKVKASEVKTIEMVQGNKTSRVVAWTFLKEAEQKEWREKNWR